MVYCTFNGNLTIKVKKHHALTVLLLICKYDNAYFFSLNSLIENKCVYWVVLKMVEGCFVLLKVFYVRYDLHVTFLWYDHTTVFFQIIAWIRSCEGKNRKFSLVAKNSNPANEDVSLKLYERDDSHTPSNTVSKEFLTVFNMWLWYKN